MQNSCLTVNMLTLNPSLLRGVRCSITTHYVSMVVLSWELTYMRPTIDRTRKQVHKTIFLYSFYSGRCILGVAKTFDKEKSNKNWFRTKEPAFFGPQNEHVFANFKLAADFCGENYANFWHSRFRRVTADLVWVFDGMRQLRGSCFIV